MYRKNDFYFKEGKTALQLQKLIENMSDKSKYNKVNYIYFLRGY